jgi:hypothetical protein
MIQPPITSYFKDDTDKPEVVDDNREAFEAWARKWGYDITHSSNCCSGDCFENPETIEAWRGWQARGEHDTAELEAMREALLLIGMQKHEVVLEEPINWQEVAETLVGIARRVQLLDKH